MRGGHYLPELGVRSEIKKSGQGLTLNGEV